VTSVVGTDRARPLVSDAAQEQPDSVAVIRAIADPTRWEIVMMVSGSGEVSCTALRESLALSKATMSHHLRVLCDAGVLRSRRDGRTNHYSLRRRTMAESLSSLWDVLVRRDADRASPRDRAAAAVRKGAS
jgi:ArsR family transcriptional regulator